MDTGPVITVLAPSVVAVYVAVPCFSALVRFEGCDQQLMVEKTYSAGEL
jgi:hypothetical protein